MAAARIVWHDVTPPSDLAAITRVFSEVPENDLDALRPQATPSGAAATVSEDTGAHPAGLVALGPGPVGERESLARQLQRHGYPGTELGQRFAIEGVLGTGSTACVFAAHDGDLDRPIALKVLSNGPPPSADAVRCFIEEARITASLDHPNVLPVHEIEMNAQQQIFFTMKRIDGDSLASLIERSSVAATLPPLGDANAVTTIFIGVCQALALAHGRGIVHQDIKPDNILIGSFGEVLVCDWGSAVRLGSSAPVRLYGSPLYMSPEQARLEGVDRRSDVYCIGATLFHVLTLRPPTWHDDVARFWSAKRAGTFQAPTAVERRRVVAPLLAIACKALAAEPAGRYADAGELLKDLRAYQAGLAVAAAPESAWRRWRRWHRRHGRTFWSWTVAASVVLGLVATLWGERLEEYARWGAPKAVLCVATPDWTTTWKTMRGSFAPRDQGVVSTDDGESLLIYDHPFGGAVAIDYEAEILPGTSPCDISAFWARDVVRSPDGHGITGLTDPYYFKVGAFDNAFSEIDSGNDGGLASIPFRPQIGRRYHIRDEIIDNRLTMSVDGRVLCEWIEPFPFTHGYVGLQAFYPGKYFGPVMIYQRQSPLKVPVTAIADASVNAGEWTLAASQYAQIEDDHPGTAIGDEARYKHGLCLWHQQAWDAAQADWRELPAAYADRIQLNRIERAIDIGDVAGATANLEQLSQAHDPQIRARDALLWNRLAVTVCNRGTAAEREDVYALYLRRFASFPSADATACTILLSLNRPQEILDRFPDQRFNCCMALLHLGRLEEIVDRYPEQRALRDVAAFLTGRWDVITPNIHSYHYLESLWQRGDAQRLVDLTQADLHMRQHGMLVLGRLQEIIDDPTVDPLFLGRVLTMSGRAQEALSRCPGQASIIPLLALQRYDQAEALAKALTTDDNHLGNEVQIEHAIAQLQAGNPAVARPLLTADARAANLDWRGSTPDEALLIPWLDDCAGFTTGALDRQIALLAHNRDNQRQTEAAAQMLAGSMSAADFLHQPARWNAPARLILFTAILDQRRGDRIGEARAETSWLALPPWQKDTSGCSAADLIVRWRLQQLGSAPLTGAATPLPGPVPGHAQVR